MATPFHHTLRSLDAGPSVLFWSMLGGAVVLLAGWATWLFGAEVTVRATSTEARLEVDARAHDVTAPVTGRVERVAVALGDEVTAGQVLVELDAEETRRQLEAETARRDGFLRTAEAVAAELEAERRRLGEERAAATASVERAGAEVRRADAEATAARDEVDRLRPLAADGVVGRAELERAEAELARAEAELDTARSAREQAERRAPADASVIAARLEELRGDLETLRAEARRAEAELARLGHRLDLHRVRAPVDGRVGQLEDLRPGAVVTQATRLAAVVPPGTLRVIAELTPLEAIGRVRPDQQATVRFDGFPWTQYGTLAAITTRVASEPADGRIRVELEPRADDSLAVPLQHGLTASVEIDVERATPATLVLRAAGRRLTGS
ncbi:MAG: HlyD family efflux transporter periplasmic adaptor subunit [Acidobacteriota bacterium]